MAQGARIKALRLCREVMGSAAHGASPQPWPSSHGPGPAAPVWILQGPQWSLEEGALPSSGIRAASPHREPQTRCCWMRPACLPAASEGPWHGQGAKEGALHPSGPSPHGLPAELGGASGPWEGLTAGHGRESGFPVAAVAGLLCALVGGRQRDGSGPASRLQRAARAGGCSALSSATPGLRKPDESGRGEIPA